MAYFNSPPFYASRFSVWVKIAIETIVFSTRFYSLPRIQNVNATFNRNLMSTTACSSMIVAVRLFAALMKHGHVRACSPPCVGSTSSLSLSTAVCCYRALHQYLRCTLDLLACEGIHFEDNDHTTLYLSFSLLPVQTAFLLVESINTTKPSQTHKTKQPTPHLLPTEVEQEEDKTMDVTFVLEESGVTATVEVPCEADVAAAKEVACTALAVSPASVEMRIGTQVLEGTCRLQDTAFGAGVQVVLARRFADIKCPAQYTVPPDTEPLSLSSCGALCVYSHNGVSTRVGGFDTETFETAFEFEIDLSGQGPPVISQCKARCYMACKEGLHEVALPGGEVLRKVDGPSSSLFACGTVVASKGIHHVSVYDEDLTLLRSLSHEGCVHFALSDCGGWVITSSRKEENVRLWDVSTGEAVACVPAEGWCEGVALSRYASVFALGCAHVVEIYDWSGAALGSIERDGPSIMSSMKFTPCGKYLVVRCAQGYYHGYSVQQYDVATMSCVRVFSHPDVSPASFALSPCSRVVVFTNAGRDTIVTRHLYPY